MKPNLDRRGQMVRGLSGLLFLGLGVFSIFTDWPTGPRLWWWWTCGAFALGVFQVFEAKQRWCIVRACGIRTPL